MARRSHAELAYTEQAYAGGADTATPMPTVLIFSIDLLLAALAVEAAGTITRLAFHPDATLGLVGTTVAAAGAIATAATVSYLTGLNSASLLIRLEQVVARVVLVGLMTTLALLVTTYFVWYVPIGRTSIALAGVLTTLLLGTWRVLYGRFLARGPRIRMVVLGTGPIERRFALRLNTLAHTRYVIAGFLRDPTRAEGEAIDPGSSGVVLGVPLPGDLEPPPELGLLGEASTICAREGIGHALVVGVDGLSPAQVEAMASLQAQGVRVHTAGAVWMNVALQVPIDMVDARWVLNTFEQLDRPVVIAGKRLLDLAIAGLGISIFALMLPFLWLIGRIADPGPFFYGQDRVGVGGKTFRVHKIRTMRVSSESDQRWASKDDDRTTRWGRLLRRTRIDELPQFWNVLRGEMALVGPRPEQPAIVTKLEREIPYFGYRHLVKPGITGWAQIHQGYAASVDESAVKLSYDLYYVGRMSILLDLDIMLRTAFVMVARIGSR